MNIKEKDKFTQVTFADNKHLFYIKPLSVFLRFVIFQIAKARSAMFSYKVVFGKNLW